MMALVRLKDGAVLKTAVGGARVEWKDDAGKTLLRVDGAQPGWKNGDYALVGIEPLAVPEGKRIAGEVSRIFDAAGGKVIEAATLEDVPLTPVLTVAQRIGRLLSPHGLTLADLRAALADEARA